MDTCSPDGGCVESASIVGDFAQPPVTLVWRLRQVEHRRCRWPIMALWFARDGFADRGIEDIVPSEARKGAQIGGVFATRHT